MSLTELLENLTLEEIEELKRLKLQNQNSYNFSKITFSELKSIFNIKRVFGKDEIFEKWFNSNIEISTKEINFLNELLNEEKDFIEIYKEEDLKVKFIAPILNSIHFRDKDKEIREFYEEKLSYETEKFKLNGICDFVVSKGLEYAEKPYFFIQEFKKSIEGDDPRPQLLAELICAIELNNFTQIKGAYIIGAIWHFVILEKVEEDSYQYYISDGYYSTKIEDLKAIFKNLLFVKEEIKELAKG